TPGDTAISDCAAFESAPLPLRQTTPDPEPLVKRQCVFQAFSANFAARANPLRLPRRPALLREERFGICLGAQRPLLPVRLVEPVEQAPVDLVLDSLSHGPTDVHLIHGGPPSSP